MRQYRLTMIAQMAFSPLSQSWERGELDSPPLKLGEGLGVGATVQNFIHLVVIGQQL